MASDVLLPPQFAELEPLARDWSLPRETDRYQRRLNSTMEELQELYDAVGGRAEEAMAHLDQFELDELPEPELRLLQLLYSFITISFAIDIFKQPRIPDASSAYLDMVVEPTP